MGLSLIDRIRQAQSDVESLNELHRTVGEKVNELDELHIADRAFLEEALCDIDIALHKNIDTINESLNSILELITQQEV